MPKPAVAIVALACLASPGASATGLGDGENEAAQAIVIRGQDGDVLASVPFHGEHFAVSYRNSIYGTLAEERYAVLPDGRYRLVEIAADQLAVLEEYYAVPGAPRRAAESDRREWVVSPDPERPTVLRILSIAATDLGERTVHVPGEPPLELWWLVGDRDPFVVLDIEEKP
ncbi:hypothetical protein [Rhodospirillaceae bacterium SYSU D60014]|uniref:hypothetical protein n=1 Tax=Virgifigura deserti TaxID=2268457 RepID=UPI000E66ECFA